MTMKAVVFEGPRQVAVRDCPVPQCTYSANLELGAFHVA